MQRKYIIACLVALLCLESCEGCSESFTRIARKGLNGRVIVPTTPRDGGVR